MQLAAPQGIINKFNLLADSECFVVFNCEWNYKSKVSGVRFRSLTDRTKSLLLIIPQESIRIFKLGTKLGNFVYT